MDMGDLLAQDEIWISRSGGGLTSQRLADMKSSHLANLRAWLLKKAAVLQESELRALYYFASHVQGEEALNELDREIARAEEESPLAWMESKPLFEAITRQLASRLEETHGG